MSVDVLLMNLSGGELFTAHRADEPRKTNPLGILSLAAACEEQGLAVALREFNLVWPRRSEDDVEAFVAEMAGDAQVLGVGCDSAFLPFLLSAVPALRRSYPDRRIVLGGYGPTMASETILRDFPEVDAVVLGEGERVFPEMVLRWRRGETPEGLRGVDWRDGDRVRHGGGMAERIQDLDRLPMTPWHLVDVSRLAEVTLMTSRGCPYPCPYCSIRTVWQARNVPHSMDRVMEEIARLRLDHGVRDLRLYDDTFTMDRKRVLEFCRRLQSDHLDVKWFCYARIDRVDDEMMAAMAESGCERIRFGVESMSNRVLAQMKGGYDAASALETLRRCARHFPGGVEVNFMYGFPEESWEDFSATLRVAMDLSEQSLAHVVWYRLTLYPLTPIYRKWSHALQLDPAAIPPEFRSEWRLLEPFVRKHPELCTHYYTVPSPELARKERAVSDFRQWHYRGTLSRDLRRIRDEVALPETRVAIPALPHLREETA